VSETLRNLAEGLEIEAAQDEARLNAIDQQREQRLE
jgi:hypothetical protein